MVSTSCFVCWLGGGVWERWVGFSSLMLDESIKGRGWVSDSMMTACDLVLWDVFLFFSFFFVLFFRGFFYLFFETSLGPKRGKSNMK